LKPQPYHIMVLSATLSRYFRSMVNCRTNALIPSEFS
jgi:hypothetical protein